MFASDNRPGEVALPFDPGREADDARLIFIGRIHSAWKSRADCPKNLREARARGEPAAIRIEERWRQGLSGLSAGSPLIVIYWMQEARRDLIVQAPRHAARPSGVFSLRSPVRPNPLAFAAVDCLALDPDIGLISIDAIDALDGTPVLDIKPWLASVDVPPTIDRRRS